ncbi:MAG: ATP-binding protein [Candidatus Aenigmarchaeota archaeon]|nr:ATP-binding protein [Candidatus Aenigmarchaeota archaeon]
MNKPVNDTEFLETFVKFSPTKGQYEQIEKHFPKIQLVTVETKNGPYNILDPGNLDVDDQLNLYWDIKFFENTPWLPDENFCSRLDNYFPKNETQEALLDAIYHLLDLKTGSAGICISGPPAVGKTHCAVGAGKELMKKASNPFYFLTEEHYNISQSLEPDSVFILDDLNSPYGVFKDIFLKIIQFVHEKGGRVFVTSNMGYDDFLEHAFVGNRENEERILDRMKGLFYVLEIEGQSERTSKTWYEALER